MLEFDCQRGQLRVLGAELDEAAGEVALLVGCCAAGAVGERGCGFAGDRGGLVEDGEQGGGGELEVRFGSSSACPLCSRATARRVAVGVAGSVSICRCRLVSGRRS
jgi:hypothetical protein